MGDVMEFDMGSGGNRGRPPPRIASRLASGRRSSGAKSTDGPLRARPPSGRADAKGSEPGTIAAKRPSASSTDSFGARERDSARRGRGSSDDEAAAKPRARRADSPTGYGRSSSQHRGSFDAGVRGVDEGKFRLGQKVEGRFRGKGRWYKGRIIGVKGRGKYDVRYEDGDEDLDLDSSAIKSEGADAGNGDRSSPRRNDGRRDVAGERRVPSPRVGDRVEARVPGTTRWQGGTVVGENLNGTLDVRLRNGVEEKQLGPSMIRQLEDGGGVRGVHGRDGRGGNDSASDVERASGRASGGEARRPGSRSPGRRVISGGGSEGDLNAHSSFHEGDKIEARYKRGRKWYPGVIQAMNRDGTMDIKYKDGDQEYDVEPGLVRSLGTASANSLATSNSGASDIAHRGDYAVGEKVEARFGGRARWFKATVDAKNRDGSYVLTYDDGDVERRVESDLIRRIDVGAGKRPGSRSPGRRVVSGIGTDSEVDPVRGGKLREGDEVEARYKRGRKWYPGVIQAMNRDGTMDIKYKDGDREYDVEPGLVRSLGAASANSLATSNSATSVTARSSKRNSGDFAPGEKVEARFGGRARWFKATVDAKNRDGSYVLTYNDGDVERRVESDLIRRIDGGVGKRPGSRSPGRRVVSGVGTDSEADPLRGGKLREGDEVEARYKRGRKWYPGVIEAINRDGTMDIKYKDGDREYDVEAAMIRGSKSADSIAASAGDVAAKEEFSEGDRVEARFGGRSRWLRATVERKNRDGTYWLIYADGDQERAVESILIRRRGDGGSPQRPSTVSAARRGVSAADSASDLEPQHGTMHVNDEIEARYKGGRKWYRGKVRALNRDGTYDIRYADGDTERDVKPEFVRVTSVVSLDSAAGSDDFVEGEKVEARFGGRSRWFKGTIERKNRDGSYRVLYADGDKELAVEKHMIRRVQATSSPRAGSRSPGRRVVSGAESEVDNTAGKVFRVGNEVEARYKRGRKWFPGKVRAVNRDGTIDIKYKDGDSERDVEPGFVRSLGAASTTSLATSASGGSETARGGDRKRVGEGDQDGRHLRGKINSVDSLTSDLRHGRSYNIGDKVEARFRGGSRWYKAIVERENPDGSYYLIYEDGDKERAVGKSMIRSLNKARGEAKQYEKDATEVVVAHRVGDAVEARYKRGLKWYAGTVRRINRDGTMDVEYIDGDFERDVEPAFVRQIGGNRAGEVSSALVVGDKVEGRFGGGARWFKATVERKNRDGTFSLLYADGDKERAVKREFIKKLDGGASGGRRPGKEDTRDSARRVTARATSETGTDVDQEEGKSSDRGENRDKAKSGNPARAGDIVEARFRGGSRWLMGEATRVHRDGSYDVEFDGGQSERNIQASHVRLPAKQSSGTSESSDSERRIKKVDHKQAKATAIMEGDRVEARLRGRSTWHSGEVTRIHSDGTYDVRYSRNGELEKRLEPRLVRRAQNDTSTTRDGSPRVTSHRRSGVDNSSGAEDFDRGRERGHREPIPQDPVTEDAQAAATKVRRALRRAGKTVDDFARKLERVRRVSGGRDSRGRSVVGSIDKNALDTVLAGVGVTLSPHESRALRRCCPDIENDSCVDPSTLASLVRGRSGSPNKRPRSSGSHTRGGRSPSSSSAVVSVQSASDSGAGATAARPQRARRTSRSRSRSRSRRRDGSGSSLDRASSGSASDLRRDRGKRHPGSDRRLRSTGEARGGRSRSTGQAGTSSESGGDGGMTSDSRDSGSALIGKVALRACKKLEGPAIDGSLRQEYDKLSGGRRRELSVSRLKPLLKRFRIKLEDAPLAEVISVLDTDDVGSFSLEEILEVALSTVEEKQIAKIHSNICEQLFSPSGRGRAKQHKGSRQAEAASAAISKTLSKLEHSKGSGLLATGDLKKLLQKAGARVSSDDAELLAERLDPADRGQVDREAFVLWLTSGFDTARAELRASCQLRLLKAKKNIRKPEKAFREFDADRRGEVKTKDFVAALGKLSLLLTHGQANALATRHHKDYEQFLADLGDPPRNLSEETISTPPKFQQEPTSDHSDSGGGGTKGRKRRKSWIESFGGRRRSGSKTSRSKHKGGGDGDSSSDSDGPLTSGSSNERAEDGDKEGGLLLGRRARAALRDTFERVCSATGGVKAIFCSAAGATETQDILLDREEARRFLRRLKLDVAEEDRAALLDALAGPPCSSDIGGHSSRGAGERGVSFEGDGGGKKRAKRGDGSGAGGKSDGDGEGGGNGGATRVLYRDFLELVLADQEPKELSKIHGKMSKDLARAADRSGKPAACSFALVVKALSKHDLEGTGFVKATEFKRSLEKLGFGGLSSGEKSLLVRRFDPVEDGMINYEAFGAWLSSGLDLDRLVAKLGRLLGQLTGKNSRNRSNMGSDADVKDSKKNGRGGERARDKAKKHLIKVGVRGLFEELDEDVTGSVSRHDMKVVLRRTLGLPLTEGDLRALFKRLDKDGDGMLDYEELLALASKKGRSERDGGIRPSTNGILSKLKEKGSAMVRGAPGKNGSKRERDLDRSSGESDVSKDDNSQSGDEGDSGGARKCTGKDHKKKKKRKKNDKEECKGKGKKVKGGRGEGGDGRRGSARRNGVDREIKGARLERKLTRLRISILQQSAATAAASSAESREREGGGGGSGDEKQDDSDDARGGTNPAAVTEKWTAMFEARDRAGTGRATGGDLQAVLEKAGVKIPGDDVALLTSVFAAQPSAEDRHSGSRVDIGQEGEKEEEMGERETEGTSLPSAAIDYDGFVRWLSEGGRLDNALLSKVQRHLKARLSKAMDLRVLFTEMCDGSSNSGSRTSKRRGRKSTKETLSSSNLARGLRHAGLPLDREVVKLLVAAFSTSSAGGPGGRGRRNHHLLSYADFHRMVNCDGLLAVGSTTLGAGSETLDEQIRTKLLETVERAFAFFDEDNTNSIDATEVVNILRALGHDLTRGESRALLRKANVDRNGTVEFEGFQGAVMPFLLERAHSKKRTEGEMRALFDEIDPDRSGTIKREEFAYLFCGKLRLLSQQEADALLSLLDRHHSGQISWEEFVKLFELVDDRTGGGGIAALPTDLKEVVAVALRKLQMGALPDVEGQLSSFLGMPSSCRKSVLAPLDHIKELSLQWVLMPKLDSRGCIQLQDMSVKVTTEVAEVEASKAPPGAQGQVLVKTANLADRGSDGGKSKKKPARSLAATLGLGKRDKSPPPAVTESKGTKTRRRSSILGAGLMETTTTVMKRATLQEVGASTEEGGSSGRGGGGGRSANGGGVMQVELSVKHAFGIPVARDSRIGDIRQRGMRACLFYDASREVDKNTGEASSEYGQHFLCNTYKTLAIQHPQKEEQWLFPDSSEGERKFLVRTDFGSGSSDGRHGHRRRRSSSGGNKRHQGMGDESPPPSSSFRGDRKRLFLLVELTCTVQTAAMVDGRDPHDDGAAGVGRGKARGVDGVVRGPLKNFRRSSGRRRVGGIRSRGGGDDVDDDDLASYDSAERSSADDYSEDGSKVHEENSGSQSSRSSRSDADSDSDGNNGTKRENKRHERRTRSETRKRSDKRSEKERGKTRGRTQALRKRGKNATSAPPRSRGGRGRHGAASRVSRDRGGVRSEGPGGRSRRRSRNSSSSGSESNDEEGSRSGDSRSSSASRKTTRGRRIKKSGVGGKGTGTDSGGSRWRGGWGGATGTKRKGRRRNRSASEDVGGDEGDEMVEVEMSCGWALIPFLELVEAHEVKKVRYKLIGGTPFAKTDINEDEVMTRRYGWRAVLKAMKMEGMHKGSEVEIKILPVNILSKVKQDDIFRLPRNVILSDTFVSLVRYYREYAANSLAKRSAMGMGNAGFGAGSASSEPVLALFPRLAADPALMMALKNQWEVEVRKTHVDGRLGATLSGKLIGLGLGGGGGSSGAGLAGITGAAREACMMTAFEKAVMRLWPAFCHIDAQRRRGAAGKYGVESYEELENRGGRIRQILDSTDSFHSDTPTNALHRGEAGGGRKGIGGGTFSSAVSQEGRVMVAFTLKEVAFDVA